MAIVYTRFASLNPMIQDEKYTKDLEQAVDPTDVMARAILQEEMMFS